MIKSFDFDPRHNRAHFVFQRFYFRLHVTRLPILTSLTPSASMACNAVDTFSRWWCWFAGRGFHRGRRRFVSTSTRAQRRVPSRKSSARSSTGPPPTSPACFRCSFTQFRKVLAWISTQRSSWPLIGIPLAAVPSAERATRPTSCSGRSCSVDCILGFLSRDWSYISVYPTSPDRIKCDNFTPLLSSSIADLIRLRKKVTRKELFC